MMSDLAQGHSEAQKALLYALAVEPQLTLYGYPKTYTTQDRAQMFRPDSLAQIETALAWLDVTKKTKTPARNSYGAKHAAERWGKENGLSPYVANGALLAAAIFRKVTMRRIFGSPNALLGLSLQRPGSTSSQH